MNPNLAEALVPTSADVPWVEAIMIEDDETHTHPIGLLMFLHSQPAVDVYNILSGELRRHPDLARRFYDAGPGRTLANLAAILASAPDRLAIGNPQEAAEALFGLWQGASNYQVSLGVETADHTEAIAKRVEHGIELFMRAYGCETR